MVFAGKAGEDHLLIWRYKIIILSSAAKII